MRYSRITIIIFYTICTLLLTTQIDAEIQQKQQQEETGNTISSGVVKMEKTEKRMKKP